jgi:hypothetical protein
MWDRTGFGYVGFDRWLQTKQTCPSIGAFVSMGLGVGKKSWQSLGM